jgi:lysophospholipase L1-like esterase
MLDGSEPVPHTVAMTLRFERYVAIGDSSTEGLDDPDEAGGYRGWANRLAERVAQAQGGLLYANLAVRGRRAREIRAEQLGPALALKPDLATVFAGSNDLLEPGFAADKLRAELQRMMAALVAEKAVVLTFTLPDLTGVLPIGRFLAPRVRAMNAAIRAAAAATGTRLIDFAAYPAGSDPRLWSADRFHVNAEGHARIAAALAAGAERPGPVDPPGGILDVVPSPPAAPPLAVPPGRRAKSTQAPPIGASDRVQCGKYRFLKQRIPNQNSVCSVCSVV